MEQKLPCLECALFTLQPFTYFNAACKLSRTWIKLGQQLRITAIRLTSTSIFASAISCSLPPPLAIFCDSLSCDLTASSLKSSKGNPSTALMLNCEFG